MTNNTTKSDLLHTSTIAAAGTGMGVLAAKAGKMLKLTNHAGKMGALIGGAGLAGDYAAVKANNFLDSKMHKSASENRYLEKIAETYSVKGHPGLGKGLFNTPKVNLDRDQYHVYAASKDSSLKPLIMGAGFGATTGLAGALYALANGGRPGIAGTITGGLGYLLGSYIGENNAHSDALEKLDIMHPVLLDLKKG